MVGLNCKMAASSLGFTAGAEALLRVLFSLGLTGGEVNKTSLLMVIGLTTLPFTRLLVIIPNYLLKRYIKQSLIRHIH
jgi:hypothetical protein